MAELPETFLLNEWCVDSGANRLRRGDTEIKLESKMMAVLRYLAEHRGELVTREALERAVWGNAVVGYDALTVCIGKLRKVLEDDPRHPRYVETISRKGYRLIGTVSAPASQARPAALRDAARWQGIGAAVAVLVVAVAAWWLWPSGAQAPRAMPATVPPSIVVLPLANLSEDPGQDFYSDGITADLTTALSKLSGLFVISPASASSYRGVSRDVTQIAQTLGVRYVLQGSVRRAGDRLRVNVGLIDADTERFLWSENYDRELGGVFDVQDDITAKIVDTLSVKLTEAERRRTARRYTTSIEAYEDFLRAQALYMHHNQEDNELAREYFQRAIHRDGRFARAYGAMALTYVAQHRNGWNGSTAAQLDRALELARTGASLDDELPQLYWVLGYVHLFRQEYQQAARAATRAVELQPNFADSYLTLAACNMHFGAPAQALQLVRKAMLLNPKYPAAYASVLGQAYFHMGEYEQAVAALSDALERNMNLTTPHVFLVVALAKLNRMEEAVWAAEQLRTVAPQIDLNHIARMLPVRDARMVEDMKVQLRRAGL